MQRDMKSINMTMNKSIYLSIWIPHEASSHNSGEKSEFLTCSWWPWVQSTIARCDEQRRSVVACFGTFTIVTGKTVYGRGQMKTCWISKCIFNIPSLIFTYSSLPIVWTSSQISFPERLMESVRALAEGKHPSPCQGPLIVRMLIGGPTEPSAQFKS